LFDGKMICSFDVHASFRVVLEEVDW
jgi:hypothetical protein